VLIFNPCRSELFNHRAAPGGLASILLCPAPNIYILGGHYSASTDVPVTIKCVPQQILLSSGGRKAPSSMGKISTAEVLRLRATSAVSRDQSARRSAQDDDLVGVLTKNNLNKLALMETCPQVSGPSIQETFYRSRERMHFSSAVLDAGTHEGLA
jgi:hypothetical protein